MNVKKIALITLSLIMLASFMVTVVSASTATSVGSIWADSQPNDQAGNYKIREAYVGQTVYIYWEEVYPDGGTVDIIVEAYDNNQVYFTTIGVGTGLAPAASGTVSFIVPNVPGGVCNIKLNGISIIYSVASVTVFVVPESVLGSAMAALAGFAAFGAIGIVKHKRSKNPTA